MSNVVPIRKPANMEFRYLLVHEIALLPNDELEKYIDAKRAHEAGLKALARPAAPGNGQKAALPNSHAVEVNALWDGIEAHAQRPTNGSTQGPSDKETLRASEPPPRIEAPEPLADNHYEPPGEPLKERIAPTIVSASALQSKMFGPIKFLVKGYVVEGATILAGKPKVGKSWLVLDMALAVARGGFCLGDVHSKEGAVLYIALEDNERRIKERITKILGEHYGDWPKNFEYATEWPRANEGGLEAIRAWISSRPNARLVVVDVLEGFRTTARGRDNLYAADYSTIKGLQSIASEMHVGIIIVHHLRKALSESGDPQDMISGSLGLPGGADSSLVLHGNAQGMVLYGRGRDLIEFEKSVRFNRDTCRWEVLGEAGAVRISTERSAIIDVLENSPEPMTPIQISQETDMKRANVRQLLKKLVIAGEVVIKGRSQYFRAKKDLVNIRSLDHNERENEF